VAGHQADFVHHDGLASISMGGSGEAHDCHRHPELKRKVYSALQESDEGELSVAIPRDVSLKQTSNMDLLYSEGRMTLCVFDNCNLTWNPGATPEPFAPGPHGQVFAEFSPIVVTIAYSLRNPVEGVQFVLPSDNYPFVSP